MTTIALVRDELPDGSVQVRSVKILTAVCMVPEFVLEPVFTRIWLHNWWHVLRPALEEEPRWRDIEPELLGLANHLRTGGDTFWSYNALTAREASTLYGMVHYYGPNRRRPPYTGPERRRQELERAAG